MNKLPVRTAGYLALEHAKLSGDTIKFGATVTLIAEETGAKKTWQIVGEPEADAHKGKISVVSPIAPGVDRQE